MRIVYIPGITVYFFTSFFLYLNSEVRARASFKSPREISKQELKECIDLKDLIFCFLVGISIDMITIHDLMSKLHPASLILKRAKE